MKPLILVLCTGNSCRSHMGEGILRRELGDKFTIASAGSKPAGFVHPLAIRVMKEIGIDISNQHSKHLDEFLQQKVEAVITVCNDADKACPLFPGQVTRHHFPFEDPACATSSETKQLEVFRRIRDEMLKTFTDYAASLHN